MSPKEYNFRSWTNALEKVPCFLIGNGPSLKDRDNLHILEGYFSIGTNRIFKIMDPTILMWQDLALWLQHSKDIMNLKAMKYCRRSSDQNKGGQDFYHFQMSGKSHQLPSSANHLFGRGSTGPLSFELAYILGCDPIILVGMDCCYDGQYTDFYGKNPMHKTHTLPACIKGLQWIKSVAGNKTIINCSLNNEFKNKMTLEEAIEKVGAPTVFGRDDLRTKILGIK